MRYDTSTYKKHKRPKGWGSLCPDDMNDATPQELLETSVAVDGARYNIDGDYCYRAFTHGADAEGKDLWHGHPIPWSRLPTEAKNGLIANKRLNSAFYRKAIRKGLGGEFST